MYTVHDQQLWLNSIYDPLATQRLEIMPCQHAGVRRPVELAQQPTHPASASSLLTSPGGEAPGGHAVGQQQAHAAMLR
jgi:hypothetical protein